MAIDIGPKIGMDGEAEFRKQLNNINTALKTLGTEMQRVTSEFSENAQGQQALTAKNQILTKSIETQKKKVREVSRALKEAQERYGENSNEALKWEQVLNRSKTSLNNMESELKQNRTALDEMEKGLRDAETGVKSLGDEAEKTENKFSGFGEIFKATVLVEGIKSIGSAISGVVSDTKEYRKIMASLEVSSQNAGYTAEQTAQSYKQLYGVLGDDQTAATTTANLQALGVSQKELTDLTNGTIGAWAKYGDSIPIDGLAEAVNETVRAGQVTGTFADVLNWGSKEGETFGVKLKAATKENEAWNQSVSEAKTAEDFFNLALQDAGSEAERANLVLQAMADQGLMQAGEAWQKQNEDIVKSNQATADFSENMAKIAQKVSPITQSLQEGFNKLLTELIKITDNVDFSGISEGIEKGFSVLTDTVLPKVKEFGSYIIENKDAIIAAITGIGTGFLAWKVGTIVTGISEIIKGTSSLASVLPGLSKAISAVNTVMKANPIMIVVSLIASLVSAIIVLWNTNEDFRNAVKKIFGDVKKTIDKIVKDVTGFFENLGQKIGETWDSIKKETDQAVRAVKGFFSDLQKNLQNIWNNIKTFVTNTVNAILNTIKSVFKDIVTAITNALNNAWKFIQNIWNTIKTFISTVTTTIWNIILSAFKNILSTISSTLTSAWNTIQSIWNTIKNFTSSVTSAIWNVISTAFWNVVTTVATTLNSVWNTTADVWSTVRNYISDAVWAVLSTVSDAFWNVVSAVSDTLNNVWNIVSDVWNSVTNYIGDVVWGIVDTVSNAFWNVVDGIGSAVGNVYDTVVNGFQGAIDFITSLPGQAWNWGADFIQNLIDGIRSKVGGVVNAVKNVADTITSWLHFSIPDVGPLRDVPKWMPDMIDLMVKGLEKSTPQLEKAAQYVAEKLNSTMRMDPVITTRTGAAIDYDRLERMQGKGIYLNGRLVGRELREMGFVTG